MEATTTDADLQEPQALDAQPVEQPAEAVTTPDSEPQQPSSEEEAPVAPSDDMAEYWSKKGIDISTPEGQAKAAQSYRELEQAFSRKGQEASQLKKSIEGQPITSDDARTRKLELAVEIMDWKGTKGLTTDQDNLMGEYLTANPTKNMALQYGTLTLDDVYVLSGAHKLGQPDPVAIKNQGKTEALQELSNKQQATAPKGSATTTATPKSDPFLAGLNQR